MVSVAQPVLSLPTTWHCTTTSRLLWYVSFSLHSLGHRKLFQPLQYPHPTLLTSFQVGGIPQQEEMQYTAFPGLQVLDNGPLMSMFAQLGKNITTAAPGTTTDDPVPRLLPTTAGFRFCVREIYPPSTAEPPRPPQETNPMEYSFQEATQHLYNDELIAVYPMYTWYQVLDFFP